MIYAIHWFRGIAIIFVVLSHIPLDEITNDSVGRLFGAIVKNGTLLFVFISGFLFFHLRAKFDIQKFFYTKIKNVVLPYVIILASVMITILLVNSLGLMYFSDEINVEAPFQNNGFIWHFLVGGGLIDALWYVPMAVVLFIVSPIIIYLQNYKLLLWLISGFALFLSVTSYRPFPNIYPVYAAVHFLGIYFLGCLTAKYYEYVVKYNTYIFSVTLLLYIFLLFIHELQLDYRWAWFYGNAPFSINILQLQKISLVYLTISIFSILEHYKIKIRLLDIFADLSFGIFFVHGILIYIFRKVPIIAGIESSYIKYAVFSLTVLLLSIVVIKVIKIVAGKNSRYFIGC